MALETYENVLIFSGFNQPYFIHAYHFYEIFINYIITKILTEEALERSLLKATRSPKIRQSFESISFVSTLQIAI